MVANFSPLDNCEGNEISINVEIITPELAREYFDTQEVNRDVNDRRVADYVNRMRRGEWRVGQPITFDAEGKLIDGQHRLLAVRRYGKPLDFLVVRGVPSESKAVFDIGQQRTTAQIAKISGVEKPQMSARLSVLSNAFLGAQLKLRKKSLEASRNASNMVGATKGSRSPQAMLLLEEKYSEGIDFALQSFGSKDQKTLVGQMSLVRAVFFRAYYNVNQDRLLEFLKVYYTGLPYDSSEDKAALALRNYIINVRIGEAKISYKHGGKLEMYKKAESAVLQFMERKDTTYLRGSDNFEEFPLADFD